MGDSRVISNFRSAPMRVYFLTLLNGLGENHVRCLGTFHSIMSAVLCYLGKLLNIRDKKPSKEKVPGKRKESKNTAKNSFLMSLRDQK